MQISTETVRTNNFSAFDRYRKKSISQDTQNVKIFHLKGNIFLVTTKKIIFPPKLYYQKIFFFLTNKFENIPKLAYFNNILDRVQLATDSKINSKSSASSVSVMAMPKGWYFLLASVEPTMSTG